MSDSRSRSGCARCRQLHRKCDEVRPRCTRCMRRGVQCEYNRGLQWKGLWSSYRKKPSRSRRKSVIQLDSFDSNCEDTICRQFRGPTVSGSHCVYEPIEQEIVPVSARTGHDPSYRGTALSLAVDDVVDGNNVDCEWETTVAEEQVSEDEGIEQVSTSGQGLGPETASDGAELCLYKTGVPGFVSFDGCQTPGERVAYIFFLQFVSQIIPAYDGPANAYRHLATFAQTSPVLMNTIIAVSTRYMIQRGGAPLTLALSRQVRALKTLRSSLDPLFQESHISDKSCWSVTKTWGPTARLEILAAIALQFTVEMLIGGGEVKTHLNTAVNLLEQLESTVQGHDSFIERTLAYRIAFVDVTSSFFWCRRPLLPLSFWIYNTDDGCDTSNPSIREMTGCPYWVFRCLAETSHLVFDAHKDSADRQAIIAKAYRIEEDLRNYLPTLFEPHSTTDVQTQIHLETLGRCYCWAALLLLQRRVFYDARSSSRVQFAVDKLIDLMESMPPKCGPDSSLPFALYVTAHEAIRRDQRDRILGKGRLLAELYPSKTREMINDSFRALWAYMDRFGTTDATYWHPDGEPGQDPIRAQWLFIC